MAALDEAMPIVSEGAIAAFDDRAAPRQRDHRLPPDGRIAVLTEEQAALSLCSADANEPEVEVESL